MILDLENYKYEKFADHPLAPAYFRYIELLQEQNFSDQAKFLHDIAHRPLTKETMQIIAQAMTEIEKLTSSEENEFVNN